MSGRSSSRMVSAPPTALLTDASRSTWPESIATSFAMSACPKPRTKVNSPPCMTATATPGTSSSPISPLMWPSTSILYGQFGRSLFCRQMVAYRTPDAVWYRPKKICR